MNILSRSNKTAGILGTLKSPILDNKKGVCGMCELRAGDWVVKGIGKKQNTSGKRSACRHLTGLAS